MFACFKKPATSQSPSDGVLQARCAQLEARVRELESRVGSDQDKHGDAQRGSKARQWSDNAAAYATSLHEAEGHNQVCEGHIQDLALKGQQRARGRDGAITGLLRELGNPGRLPVLTAGHLLRVSLDMCV